MELELESRGRILSYKVKAMSRESPSQKAAHLLEYDLRSHWSTGTNTKEWILLELEEPCLLSDIRLYNKSVLEWEISVGLRFKPETFFKVRPRCEAPRRDVMYPMNYTPCRYVRISCHRGNPIALFYVQLMGVSVPGLEPEFLPVVNHLLPKIMTQKQDMHNMHLRLLQELTNRLLVFLPQLEADLTRIGDFPEDCLRFLAMLAGPFYPILYLVNERENIRNSSVMNDSESSKYSQPSNSLTVSSNFEPRKSRGSSAASIVVFRPDLIFPLLRKAYKEPELASVCRLLSRILHKCAQPGEVHKDPDLAARPPDEMLNSELTYPNSLVDYSLLFGEEFLVPDEQFDPKILNILDIAAVEEGVFHILYACASQPLICDKLSGCGPKLWIALPYLQALLPVLRPSAISHGDPVDDNFLYWKQPLVQQALSRIVSAAGSDIYCPLLQACAGYLASFSQSHVRTASFLIDLCFSVLSPWISQVVSKVDLAMDLMDDLLGIILDVRRSPLHARAALNYIIIGLSGWMDDILRNYKEVKHKLLFLLEMLDPFLDHAFSLKNTISVGDESLSYSKRQGHTYFVALNILRAAILKPDILPSLECEWRSGSVTPSVLLSVLEPHMQLPQEIDLCQSKVPNDNENSGSNNFQHSIKRPGGASYRSYVEVESDGKTDVSDANMKVDVFDDVNLFFMPPELSTIALGDGYSRLKELSSELNRKSDAKCATEKTGLLLASNSTFHDCKLNDEHFNVHADYSQLINYGACELKASEFKRLASKLYDQDELGTEGHNAAVDALLLAAECYVNPFFMMSRGSGSQINDTSNDKKTRSTTRNKCSSSQDASARTSNLETVATLERERDRVVLQLVLEAAEQDWKFWSQRSDKKNFIYRTHEIREHVVMVSPADLALMDAVTLVRQHQTLLFDFLVNRLKQDQGTMHEILIHSLVFLLHTATQLYCVPEDIVDIILESGVYMNNLLTSFHSMSKDGSTHLDNEKLQNLQRHWSLLHKLVIAATCDDDENRFRAGNLISPSAWMERIPVFSTNACPLVRFLGWMAVARIAKLYTKERLFLASELHSLTNLLSIFLDELALVPSISEVTNPDGKVQWSVTEADRDVGNEDKLAYKKKVDFSFNAVYPVLSKFLPHFKEQFQQFGDNILEAVGLQLRSMSSSFLPDILCWFSDLCSWPFVQFYPVIFRNNPSCVKGAAATNFKAVILYLMEAIVIEHMTVLLLEMPKVVQVVGVLCKASYSDVFFMESVMLILKPVISYSLHKASNEKILVNDSCLKFETLCFEELFSHIKMKNEDQDNLVEEYRSPLIIYVLGSVFADLSFELRREILQCLTFWAGFPTFEPTTSFHDYLIASNTVMESCQVLLLEALGSLGAYPFNSSDTPNLGTVSGGSCEDNGLHNWSRIKICDNSSSQLRKQVECARKSEEQLSSVEMVEFSVDLENLIDKLNITVEQCWSLHPQLGKKLAIMSAQCFMYSKCLSSIGLHIQQAEGNAEDCLRLLTTDQFSSNWRNALQDLAESARKLQEKHCWEVASVIVDCLLGSPSFFQVHDAIVPICSAINTSARCAPKITWRLQVDKWLSTLFERGVHCFSCSDKPLAELFVKLLGHPEPELRYLSIKHIGRLAGYDMNFKTALDSSRCFRMPLSSDLDRSVPKSCILNMISQTWDQVVLLASSDVILSLRVHAMSLLLCYIPYGVRHQLQSFLSASDSILHALGKNAVNCSSEGPFLMLSLVLIATTCFFSPAEDIYLIPQEVWRNIEIIGSSKTAKFGDLAKLTRDALCKLRNEGDQARQALGETLFADSEEPGDSKFEGTRQLILQVLPNLTAAYSCFDLFSTKIDEEAMELRESEIELEILRKEDLRLNETSLSLEKDYGSLSSNGRLQKIRDEIQSIEKSKIEKEIVARRQKRLLFMRSRQKQLEEAAVREEELLRDLDRERQAEAEKDIERQRQLESERAKTKELRHQLDLEKERQTQREIQRELEQNESGLRSSRREFPAAPSHSRTRERYRDRESDRAGMESSARTSGTSLPIDISTTPAVFPQLFAGQPPTILQSRDRSDECGSSHDDTMEGSKDSGDTGSIGDLDLITTVDGQSSGRSSQRQGLRGSKTRQMLERRERDVRREGKWERKH